MRRDLFRALRWLAAPVLLLGVAVLPTSAEAGATLSDLRDATVKFHSMKAAARAGYVDPGLPCFDDLAGGMGTHLVKPESAPPGQPPFDMSVEALAPEGLVYELREDGKPQLVAVEYITRYDPDNRPQLFGQDFNYTQLPNGAELWTLHAWIYENNPAGVFASYNPDQADCPAGTDSD